MRHSQGPVESDDHVEDDPLWEYVMSLLVPQRLGAFSGLLCLLFVANGCATLRFYKDPCITPEAQANMPRELAKITMPEYRVEAPDILIIEAIKIVPKAPYHIEAMDTLQIQVIGALPEQPILGLYQVNETGDVNLGPPYGVVHVLDLTVDECMAAIQKHLQTLLQSVVVTVTLGESGARQQVEGEHLVYPDGKVRLGSYGGVYVAGMTLDEVKAAVEQHLSQFMELPEISVDMFALNSKVYYIIQQGAGEGDSVDKFPITGNETVLDALAEVNGLASVASMRIWIARPAPYGMGKEQMLPVDWHAISAGASTATNYQIRPGDRIYVAEDKLVAFDVMLRKIITPAQRIISFDLLGSAVVRTNKTFRSGSSAGGIGGGGFF